MAIKKIVLALSVSGLSALYPLLSEAASHRKIVYIDQYDQDLDGKVSSLEFETSRRNRFDLTDTNKNGTVDSEEYVFEWEDRLDVQLANDREGQVKQTAARFKSLDDDENTLISWEEFESSGLRSFTRFDTNEDGKIDDTDEAPERKYSASSSSTKHEKSRDQILTDSKRMLSMPSTHSKEGTLAQYDDNDDGTATTAEFTAGRLAFFSAMDENGDGSITPDEYLAEFEDRLDSTITEYRKKSVKQAYVRFGALDKDENETMTFKEYQTSGHRSFSRWDTDGNGYVTLEEKDPKRREFSKEEIDAEKKSAEKNMKES